MHWSRVPMVVWLMGLLGQIWYIISYAIAVVRRCLFFVIYTFWVPRCLCPYMLVCIIAADSDAFGVELSS